ncbi:acyltransferase [Dactylosporangium sp. NPDC000555]|uniref:acyltransferase family protein n=1 Tax=Dactylosporangium sp. NPDC000555 TaxID=3154260 RepID=UPI00331757EF
MTTLASVAARIDAVTPQRRDRTVDGLRAFAIAGVVLGHWLVSAVVSAPDQPMALHGDSPLRHAQWYAPATWLLETLGLFFAAAGYAAARGLADRPALPWLRARLTRLLPPVLALAAVWLPALGLLRLVGSPDSTRHLVLSLVSHPLWFLLVYAVLTACAPLLVRCPPWAVVVAVAAIAGTDALRPHGLPTWLGLIAVPVGWAAPYLCGTALAAGRLRREHGLALLALGVVGGAALVALGYPASAVGVPGDRWSNLDPPSLFALAVAAAQFGVFLVVRPSLARMLARPRYWLPVATLNLAAMTVFCWHQTALLLVTFTALPTGRPPGLLDAPSGLWPLYRLLWLPVFATVLVGLARTFHRFERR